MYENVRDLMLATIVCLLIAVVSRPCSAEPSNGIYLDPPSPPSFEMRCTRWAALVQAVVDLGPERMELYMKANPKRFTPADYAFLGHASEFVSAHGLRTKGAFATAMEYCGDWVEI